MEFNKAYNRQEFVKFLHNFLPDDLTYEETPVTIKTTLTYTKQAIKLGESASLDLVVYEIRHNSKNDARVSLSKEAFRLLADKLEDRALVIFVPEDNNENYRFSLIEITLEAKEDSARITRKYSNPRRYSYFLGEGIAYYTPNKYLNDKGRVVSPDDLRSRFSVEVLTKEFYQELSDWYAWAIKIIRFPNNLNDKTDNDKFNHESAIRLITRLIFVWFLKQRHLVPDEFFDEQYLAENLIKDFAPNAKIDLFYKSEESKYYKAILQNLFFAMLNSPITPERSKELSERHFRNGRGDYDNNKLMRYETYFKNPQLFIDLANQTVPFLNGGLFDCLDDKDKDLYYDGFSDREAVKKELIVPDYLFFGEEAGKNIDLSEWYGDKKKKKVSARGIIDILKRYNFTVEENTPFDQEVSLDPELLGKVFENLLASYNPETQTTARKQTGSFYTPREIVQYMVDESLVAHLKRTVGDDLEEQYRQLMQYTDETVSLTDNQRKQIMRSLYHCKVLDPACGSGAFPMGMLQQMVHILSRIDPNNTMWREMMRAVAIDKTSKAYLTASDEEQNEIINDIERSFNDKINRPDYARKLYLIENCIYGVDIQPIAIQISKLRFFISLVVDQMTNTDPTDNFGIRPLPNLEAKFVAANTLIGLNKKDATLFDSPQILAKKEELKIAKHKIFGAKTVRTKRKYRQIVNDLRLGIANMLKDCGAVGNAEAQQLAAWDMFDQNAYSSFFDPEWMFDVKEGFDIVIGNPPYHQLSKDQSITKEYKSYLKQRYHTSGGRLNTFIFFIHRGLELLSIKSIISFIIPNTFLTQDYYKETRFKLLNRTILTKVISYDVLPFDNAVVENITFFALNDNRKNYLIKHYHNDIKTTTFDCSKEKIEFLSSPTYSLCFNSKKISIIPNTIKLKELCNINQAIALKGDKSLSVKSENTQNQYYRLLDGRNINKYCINWSGAYLDYNINRIHSCKTRTIFEAKEKLLFRRVSTNLIFAYDNQQYYALNTIVVVTHKNTENVSLKYLLALLNSKLLNYYYASEYKSTKKVFSEIQARSVGELPIRLISPEKQSIFIVLVDEILKAKRENKDSSIEEQKIDMLIYHLYGLTYNEMLIVDPQTSITREEYEKGDTL